MFVCTYFIQEWNLRCNVSFGTAGTRGALMIALVRACMCTRIVLHTVGVWRRNVWRWNGVMRNIYACIYTHIYIYTYTYVYIYIYIHTHIYIYLYIYIYIFIIYTYIHVYIHMHTNICVYTCIHILHIYKCNYIRTYIHISSGEHREPSCFSCGRLVWARRAQYEVPLLNVPQVSSLPNRHTPYSHTPNSLTPNRHTPSSHTSHSHTPNSQLRTRPTLVGPRPAQYEVYVVKFPHVNSLPNCHEAPG